VGICWPLVHWKSCWTGCACQTDSPSTIPDTGGRIIMEAGIEASTTARTQMTPAHHPIIHPQRSQEMSRSGICNKRCDVHTVLPKIAPPETPVLGILLVLPPLRQMFYTSRFTISTVKLLVLSIKLEIGVLYASPPRCVKYDPQGFKQTQCSAAASPVPTSNDRASSCNIDPLCIVRSAASASEARSHCDPLLT